MTLILFLSSLGTLLLAMLIMFPVVSSVNEARMKVLFLFVDIPNHSVVNLALKCEKFIANFYEEHNDEIESDEDGVHKNDDSENSNVPLKRGSHKQPKNSA